MSTWGFLTNHALVLIHVANNPRSTLREIADAVGITERATSSILKAMEQEGIISRKKEGRRNKYWVNYPALLEHGLKGPFNVAELVRNLTVIARRLQESGVVNDAPLETHDCPDRRNRDDEHAPAGRVERTADGWCVVGEDAIGGYNLDARIAIAFCPFCGKRLKNLSRR